MNVLYYGLKCDLILGLVVVASWSWSYVLNGDGVALVTHVVYREVIFSISSARKDRIKR